MFRFILALVVLAGLLPASVHTQPYTLVSLNPAYQYLGSAKTPGGVFLVGVVNNCAALFDLTDPLNPVEVPADPRMACASRGLAAAGAFVGGELYTGDFNRLTHAFRFTNGVITDLGTLGSPLLFSSLADINSTGEGFGTADAADRSRLVVIRAMGDFLLELPGLSPHGNSFGAAINEAGDGAGSSQTPANRSHCAYWPAKGGVVDCHTLPGASSNSVALAITSTSPVQIGGEADGRVYVWTKATGMVLQPFLPGTSLQRFGGMNDTGQVAGTSVIPGECGQCPVTQFATLWEGGVATNLNTLLSPADQAVYHLDQGRRIGPQGAILAMATVNGVPFQPVLLLPPEEPPAAPQPTGPTPKEKKPHGPRGAKGG